MKKYAVLATSVAAILFLQTAFSQEQEKPMEKMGEKIEKAGEMKEDRGERWRTTVRRCSGRVER